MWFSSTGPAPVRLQVERLPYLVPADARRFEPALQLLPVSALRSPRRRTSRSSATAASSMVPIPPSDLSQSSLVLSVTARAPKNVFAAGVRPAAAASSDEARP